MDILRMACEAGIYHAYDSEGQWDGLTDIQLIERHSPHPSSIVYGEKRIVEILERFAQLVESALIEQGYRKCAEGQKTTQFCGMLEQAVLAEREACAKVCDDMEFEYWNSPEDQNNFTPADCGQAIRERRQQ